MLPEPEGARPPAADRGALYDSFRDRTCLGDRYAIVYLPAAGLLCRGEAATALRVAVSPAPGPSSPSVAPAPPARQFLGLGSAEAGLRHATQEVERIGRFYSDARVLSGAEATERSFKELAPGYRILHLAAHGAVDPAAPLYSGLRLAADPGGLDDGVLHAFEVLPLRLPCDLVTLSACESGLGRLYAGEGLLGLARSFLCAGARRTLVSLWSVNDPSTTRFMECFYGALSRGLPAAEALRTAKREIREEVMTTREGQRISLAHPFFWAPFVLVEGGDGS
jgi:CHAT domain-containing protein